MANEILNNLLLKGAIRPIDYTFAEFIEQHEQLEDPMIVILAAYLSSRLGEQNSCIDLQQLGQPYSTDYMFPRLDELMLLLTKAATVHNVGCDLSWDQSQRVNLPIVLDNNKLYLQRYWQYEVVLTKQIIQRCSQVNRINAHDLKDDLNTLFPENNSAEIDWQKIAVGIAMRNKLTFITGGPGTGKTTTVTRLLALMQHTALKSGDPLHIQLVAPTGKAAARLIDSIGQAKLKLPQGFDKALPSGCSTIHRLLGTVPNSPFFKANQENPLHLDVLVIDEASMIDLPLMTKLFNALPEKCQLIMLGDKDQLASVEAGSVLSDICASSQEKQGVPHYSDELREYITQLSGHKLPGRDGQLKSKVENNLIVLQKSHRFTAQSGVGQLAQSINTGNVQRCISLLLDDNYPDVSWCKETEVSELVSKLMPNYIQYFKAISKGNIIEAFELLAKHQVLCAQRSGTMGVDELNSAIEKELNKQNLIDTSREFYPGRAIIVSQNDHRLQVFNGDLGIVMEDPNNPALTKVWLMTENDQVRGILPNRLPAHENVYAITIHKSQGSEYHEVHLCLPPQQRGTTFRGLSRELLYTGLTRAKKHFTLYSEQNVIEHAISHQCQRSSGLTDRLLSKLPL
jgi:exodeoxyribonuclease V alpha subunit